MSEKNNKENTTIVEEVTSTPTTQTPIEQKVPEVKFTQEQLNSIIAKEKQKSEITLQEIAKKVEQLEKEKQEEKLARELQDKLLKDASIKTKTTKIESLISEEVKEDYKKNVVDLTLIKLENLHEKTEEEIKKVIKETIDGFPKEIKKGVSNASAKLAEVEINPIKKENENKIQEKKVYNKATGNPIEISIEDYNNLPEVSKRHLEIK